jgi:hypothetical protein
MEGAGFVEARALRARDSTLVLGGGVLDDTCRNLIQITAQHCRTLGQVRHHAKESDMLGASAQASPQAAGSPRHRPRQEPAMSDNTPSISRSAPRRASGARPRATPPGRAVTPSTGSPPMWRSAADSDELNRVLLAQGGYYVATGVLPFVSRQAFEAVTGPKAEWWLVQTVGGLVTAVGAGLLSGALRRRASPELVGVAIGSAATLAGIDIVYVAKGRIAPTYLVDAVAQLGLLAGIAASLRHGPRPARWRWR